MPTVSVKLNIVVTGVIPVPLPPLNEGNATTLGAASGFSFITVISLAKNPDVPYTAVLVHPPFKFVCCLEPASKTLILIERGSLRLSVHINMSASTLTPVIKLLTLNFKIAPLLSTKIGFTTFVI